MVSLFCISNAVATLIASINNNCILIVNSIKFICCFVAQHYSRRKTIGKLLAGCGKQWWANLDQTPNDLDTTIFRDLSPTPIP
jgi:hypothetical protein